MTDNDNAVRVRGLVKRYPDKVAVAGVDLDIRRATVKTHLQRLFTKLDVDDRTHAVTVALERGLLPSPRR